MNLVPVRVYTALESSLRALGEMGETTLVTEIDGYVYFIERSDQGFRASIAHQDTALGRTLMDSAQATGTEVEFANDLPARIIL